MSLFSRLANMLRGDRLSREIDEELESHIAEAIEQGRDPAETRRAFGSPLLSREQSRDVRILPWLDSFRSDMVFGWRQLMKRKVASAAAILSLGLALGACTSAFRLIDALLLRPLPVAHPEELYGLARQGKYPSGKLGTFDGFAYPVFQQMRAAVKDQAGLIAVSYPDDVDLTYRSDAEMEKAYLQYVSGRMFSSFGLRPAVGRLLTENDDLAPGAHPYAVLSQDYWARRFGRDPKVVGRTFRMGDVVYQIVGVVDGPFTGNTPGTFIDIFVPTMMNPWAMHDDITWIRIVARLRPGVAVEPLRARLDAISYAFEANRARGFTNFSSEALARFLEQKLIVEPAAAGTSDFQRDYRDSLLTLGVLVGLVLLIACTNVANLMTAQAAARAREMALRVSIGAGRGRLVQLVMVESALLAALAAAAGAAFAWWSAPFVVSRINPPDNPARLALPADWRVAAVGLALTLAVTFLFGLAPALRASAVQPMATLRGGSSPHARLRLMHALIAVQVTFCFAVLFVSGLFSATFERLSHRPIGFSAGRILNVDMVVHGVQPPALWDQVAEHVRAVPGVETVALAGWPILRSNSWNGFLSVHGAPPTAVLAYFLNVSPEWLGLMRIHFVEGREFRPEDTSPGVAIVNETFVKQFFPGEYPLGQVFAKGDSRYQIVGVVRDAPYRSLREPILPVAYVPFHSLDKKGAPAPLRAATLVVRTASANPMALASTLRREVPRARPEFRVSNIITEEELVRAQTIRERLLAMLALFFAAVALLLAAIGLYGVLDYSVLQQRREIGIRLAIGAPAGRIARAVAGNILLTVLAGAAAGFALSMASARYVEALLYQVKPDDPAMLLLPSSAILAAALLAALPAVLRAVSIDPAATLRAD